LWQKYPLVSHGSLDDIIAYREGRAITVRRFLADVARVGKALPEGEYVLNLCNDRYRFMVGLAASVTTGKISLLPSSRTAGMFRALANFAPNMLCLTDGCALETDLPQVVYPEETGSGGEDWNDDVPLIDGGQTIAYVFTSGSTEVPVPHKKNWASLVMNVRSEAELLGMEKSGRYTLIGTVPPQHMYGLESTVLLAMQSGSAITDGRQFYPLDICASIAAAQRPRILISTPFHLRSLMAEGLNVPPVDLLLSATAPIPMNLVREAEMRFNAPLLEIYGCTESGQIACRQPSVSAEWRLFPGVRLTFQDGQIWASGGHVEGRVALPDELELTGEDCFLLRGRHADMVNIAGNRSSLAYLNHQLNVIPGVQDGVFLMPDDMDSDRVTRLVAFVVAPDLDKATLMLLLREQIHPAFLPRPLLLVDALPRNATGKLPREALLALAKTLMNRLDREDCQ
jgi:acyl-coenzyme A synthetase/AMP-(fatty) acid ligase